MSKLTLQLIAQTIVHQAQEACQKKRCGAEGAGTSGRSARPVRCAECPLDQVDRLTDAMEDTP